MMDIKNALQHVTEGHDLSRVDMATVMRSIMTGETTPAQIAGFLIALRMKGETVDEITGAAEVMRELVTPVKVTGDNIVDIVGTGGDGMHTFNISTTSALVVAAAGGKVAKHGNRSVSSRCGSADVLEALGVKLEITPEQVSTCVEQIGIGFMFAPQHHSAMKYAIGPRREMGVRTIFNVLGPLTNPAGAPNQLLGVFNERWVEPLTQVLHQLGSNHVLVVHSEDGLDEISIAAPTRIAELQDNQIRSYHIQPEDFGLERAALSRLQVENVTESIALVHSALDNQAGPARDIVVLNAGAAIYAANLTDSLAAGVAKAAEVIAQGQAKAKLSALIELTQSF